jgi:SAM-dependent methyltransferase
MDQPGLGPSEHSGALAGLGRLNRLGRAADILWAEIRRELRRNPGRVLTILDVACGDGAVLREIVRRSPRLRGIGCDISPTAVRRSRRFRGPRCRFRVLDVVKDALPPADIVCCSLFLHHLDDDQIVALLRAMKVAAARTVVVSDLERSWFSYWSIFAAARIVTRSHIVHVDSGLSVHAGFRCDELRELARAAGLANARVEKKFPCRIFLSWHRR